MVSFLFSYLTDEQFFSTVDFEVKGAVTSTRRLMKIAGLGLFVVIFVFVT